MNCENLRVNNTEILPITAITVTLNKNEFNLSRPPVKQITIPRFRRICLLQQNYMKFVIVHRGFLEVYGLMLGLFQGSLMQYILLCVIVLVKEWSVLDFPCIFFICSVSPMAWSIWSFILHVGGIFNSDSIKNLRSWKGKNRHLNKFRLGCRPLFLGFEGYFVMRRLSMLKFLKGVVRGTMRVLLL